MYKWMTLIVAIIAASVSPDDGSTRILDVPFHGEQTTGCRAAAVDMVGEYITGRRLSPYATDGAAGRCTDPGGAEIYDFASEVFGLTGSYLDHPLSYEELRDEIDSDRPVIAALAGRQAGHAVVVSGYRDPDLVVVLHPLSGRHVLPYEELLRYWQPGVWAETIRFAMNREDFGQHHRVH